MTFTPGQSGNPGAQVIHGLYKHRRHVCVCGAAFVSQKPGARFCSNACKTGLGPWSYPSNQHRPTEEASQ